MPNVTFYISDSSHCSNFWGKCHINKDFVIYQRKLLCVAGLAIAFSLSFSPPSPSSAPYSACAGCFKSASHKKSLSQ